MSLLLSVERVRGRAGILEVSESVDGSERWVQDEVRARERVLEVG